jgi:malate dehydrogenase (oxaloacetate-decarboxylating)(NADP+)
MNNSDVFIGVSEANLLSPNLLSTMNQNPIIFALANPDPEILPDKAHSIRDDIVMATGRSDYPNQVNNVLGFPFLFRGALDAKAKEITNEMLVAAATALAALAKEEVPQSVLDAYGVKSMSFGKEYFIPKPFDPRLIDWVAKAVREAA